MVENNLIFEINYFIGLTSSLGQSNYFIRFYYPSTKKASMKNRKLDHLIVLDEKINILAAVNSKFVEKKVVILEISENHSYIACLSTCDLELLTKLDGIHLSKKLKE